MASDLLVSTTDGVVRGRRLGDLRAWRGIPYAAPPVGPLRLQAPRPVQPWRGELDATRFGDASAQHKKGLWLGPGTYQPASENCLSLNVLAPATASAQQRPVMVFIHGGAYTLGTSASALYGGQHLVRRGDIVYVSINYRLGALGYLDFSQFSTPHRRFDSNLGLRDQVAALQWVRRNIAAFGGDLDNVTVFGESAGGNAVISLMSTPAANGLFAGAIAQSPAPEMVNEAPRAARWTREFVALLGADPADAADALESADVRELGRAGSRLSARVLADAPGLHLFGPVVDGDFLPRPPLDAFTDGTTHRVPMIIGTNGREGTLFPKFLDVLPTNPARIEKMFALTDPAARERVTSAYPGYPGERAAIDLGGDFTFWKPSLELAEAHAAHAPTYSYRFDYAPRLMHWLGLDATHGIELFAVFGIADTPFGRGLTLPGGRRDLCAVTDAVQEQWLHFARHSAPLPSWPRYDADTRATLIFDAGSRVEHDPRRERRLAWAGYAGYRGVDEHSA